MQDYDLPSPDIGSAGLALRRVVAKNISSLEVVALSYPGGKHPGAAKLRQFFLSCAAALGDGVIVDPGSPIVLIPNPGGQTVEIAGPVASVAPTDTGSEVNFMQATLTGAQPDAASLSAGLKPDGSGVRSLNIAVGNSSRFDGGNRNADGTFGGSFPTFRLIDPVAAIPVMGDTLRVDKLPGKVIYTNIKADGTRIEFYNETLGANGDSFFGTFVALDNRSSAGTPLRYTNVKYGGSAVPLRIDSQLLVDGYKPQARLAYTGSPDTYQVQIEASSGTVLVPWKDAVLSLASKGFVTATSTTAVPNSEFGTSPVIRWRQKNLPTATQFKAVVMPEGKARIGVNMSTITEGSAQRTFKDLTMYNDGYRWGSEYLSNSSEWVNADGNLIKEVPPGATFTYAFGRCDVPGARCEITWEGGDDPLLDLALSTGENVNYGNVVRNGRSIQFDYNHSWSVDGYGRIQIKRVNPANPIRNLRVKEVAMSWDGGVFAQSCIDRYKKYSYVRFMDVNGSNAANYVPPDKLYGYEWADRSTPARPKNRNLGWPAEFIIEFMNRTGCDGWVMMPASSSPDFDTKYIRGLFYGENMVGGVKLDDARIVLVEKGNEWFNSAFSIYQSSKTSAIALGHAPAGTPENDARIAEQAFRLKTMFDALTGNFPAGRLKRVFAGSPENLFEANQLYDTYNVRNFEVFSTAYYFFNVQFALQPAKWPGKDVAAMLKFAEDSIPSGLEKVTANSNWAKARGYGYWIYEGQQHWFEPTQTAPYYDEAFNKEVQQAPGMEFVFDKWFDSWTSNFGGGLTGYYAYGLPNHQYGSWGFQTDQTDESLAISPKQRSMIKALAKLKAA